MASVDGPGAATRRAGVSRRFALGLGAALPPSLASGPGRAQGAFPDRPIRLIVPWAPGSSSDVQMRSLAELAQPKLGQAVLVENRPGAGGTLHARPLAASRPDGYTLGQMHPSVVRRALMMPQMP
jgi:tripartite-type tricarboxylate transporter receptor subunit TctC